MAIDDIRGQIRREIARLQAALAALEGNDPLALAGAQETTQAEARTDTGVQSKRRNDSPETIRIRSMVMKRTHLKRYLKAHPRDAEAE